MAAAGTPAAAPTGSRRTAHALAVDLPVPFKPFVDERGLRRRGWRHVADTYEGTCPDMAVSSASRCQDLPDEITAARPIVECILRLDAYVTDCAIIVASIKAFASQALERRAAVGQGGQRSGFP